MSGSLPGRLSHEDAVFFNFDRDQFPYNVGSVGIYEGVIPFETYRGHVERRLDRVPRYRQRLVSVPFDLAQPGWHDDPDFDIDRHVSHVTLPPPGDEAQLRRLAGEFFATPLDRSKPLWEIRVVYGLRGDRTAHLAKIHHCLVDGVGGAQLLAALLDFEPNAPEEPRAVPWVAESPIPGFFTRLVDGAVDQLADQIATGQALTRGLMHPSSAASGAAGIVMSLLAATPHMFRRGKAPWSTRLTTPQRLAWQTLPFDNAHRVSEALQGTVNDVVLAVLSGAFRRYLALHGYETNDVVIRALIPVNVRAEAEERNLGNRVSFMLAGLPVGLEDPIARFRAIHEEIANLKEIDQAGNLDRLAGILSLITPPALLRLLGANLTIANFASDLVCTNVPGPRVPLFCMGHRMIEHYPWVPIGWRMGLGVAIMSYDQQLAVSLTADRSVLADLERLGDFIGEAFAELAEAAGVSSVPAMFAAETDAQLGAPALDPAPR
jgi:WS/DGAT/MGAT family acyltransferase